MSNQPRIEALRGIPSDKVSKILESYHLLSGAQAAYCVQQRDKTYTIGAIFTEAAQKVSFDITSAAAARVEGIKDIPSDKLAQVLALYHAEGVKATYYKLQGNGKYLVRAVIADKEVSIKPNLG